MSDDPVNHPKHYTAHGSGVECIEVIKDSLVPIGNAVKYVWRFQDKGKPMEDLEKALWYLKYQLEKHGPTGDTLGGKAQISIRTVIAHEEKCVSNGSVDKTQREIHLKRAELYKAFHDGAYYRMIFPLYELMGLVMRQQPEGVQA